MVTAIPLNLISYQLGALLELADWLADLFQFDRFAACLSYSRCLNVVLGLDCFGRLIRL